MKKLLTILFSVFFYLVSFSQTTNLTATTLTVSPGGAGPVYDFPFTPFRGAETWNNEGIRNFGCAVNCDGGINIPTPTSPISTQRDVYYRFSITDILPYNSPINTYSWTNSNSSDLSFDAAINGAIDKGGKFAFTIMTQCGYCGGHGGNVFDPVNNVTAYLFYPLYVHNLMQAESPKDFTYNTSEWAANMNSPSWLTMWKTLNQAVKNHLDTGNHISALTGKKVFYKDVINYVDIGGYGYAGEWTNTPYGGTFTNGTGGDGTWKGPSGTIPTTASLDTVISNVVQIFKDYHVTGSVAMFDGMQIPNTLIPAGVGWFMLQSRTNYGPLGWRDEGWGNTSFYLTDQWLYNPTSGNANHTTFVIPGGFPNAGATFHFDTAIENRWKTSPVVGEPCCSADPNYGGMLNQIKVYHVCNFGNGNSLDGGAQPPSVTFQNNWRTSSAAAGYRLQYNTGTMTTTLTSGGAFNITLNWQNVNVAPPYSHWHIVYQLRNGATVVWTDSSAFDPYLFLPTNGVPVPKSDNFTATGVPAGTYGLYMTVVDPNRYYDPMPLGITGQNADGSYLVRGGIVVNATAGPIANAGPNQNITVSSTTLTSAASVGATSQIWTQISGPNTASITTPTAVSTTVTGLVTGTYVFQVAINGGSSGSLISQVTVTVTLPVPVVANAGANQNITLPTSTATLNGSASTGTITSYLWTRVSGPNTPTITTPTTVTTTVTGLIQGVYVFQLTLNGGVSSAQTTVNVLAAPPQANAGPNQNITVSSTTLTGAASTGATSYLWSFVSGPNTPSIGSPTTVTTNVTGMIAGTYVFKLAINGGTSGSLVSTVSVVVAPPPPPSANAGPDQAITSPTNSVTLNGSASSGVITAYAWTLVSGPNTPLISTPTTVTTTVTGLIVGTYVFKLTLNGGVSNDNVNVVVNSAVVGASIFTTQTPVTGTGNDFPSQTPIQGIETGVRFRSSVDGFITGIRFYKTSTPVPNSGTHIGELYTNTGTRLAAATFTGETAQGWQQVSFVTPVAITANTNYVAAYFSSLGYYVEDNDYFTPNGVINGPLTALADGLNGATASPDLTNTANGIFKYTASPAFPNFAFRAANYYVDVIFTTVVPFNCNCVPNQGKGNKKVFINR
jgi:hypothetical protein